MVSVKSKISGLQKLGLSLLHCRLPKIHSFAVDLGLVLRCGWLRLASVDKYFGLQLGLLVVISIVQNLGKLDVNVQYVTCMTMAL